MTRKRIALVIDDDRKAQSTIGSTFWRLGWIKPVLVKRGAEALRLLQDLSQSFDVIVLDQNLPKMTGLELLATLKTIDRYVPPVIMLTGNPDPAVERQARELGAEFLTKNDLSEENLGKLLDQLLG